MPRRLLVTGVSIAGNIAWPLIHHGVTASASTCCNGALKRASQPSEQHIAITWVTPAI